MHQQKDNSTLDVLSNCFLKIWGLFIVLGKVPDKFRVKEGTTSTALSLVNVLSNTKNALQLRTRRIVYPKWHPPWKLMRVISGYFLIPILKG